MSKKDNETKSNINDLLFSQPVKEKKEIAYSNKKNPSKIIALRLKESDLKSLQTHFKLKGILNFSTGLRQIIAKYMQENNLFN